MSKRSTGVMRLKADGTSVDEDDDGVLKDGEWVAVSPMIKDASTVPTGDAVAIEDAHAAYVARMTRRVPAQSTQDAQSATVSDAETEARDAHAAYTDRLTRKDKRRSDARPGTPAHWLN